MVGTDVHVYAHGITHTWGCGGCCCGGCWCRRRCWSRLQLMCGCLRGSADRCHTVFGAGDRGCNVDGRMSCVQTDQVSVVVRKPGCTGWPERPRKSPAVAATAAMSTMMGISKVGGVDSSRQMADGSWREEREAAETAARAGYVAWDHCKHCKHCKHCQRE